MNINQTLHLLAKRIHADDGLIPGPNNEQWVIFKAPNTYQCGICGCVMNRYESNGGWERHGLQHLKEHNLLALL